MNREEGQEKAAAPGSKEMRPPRSEKEGLRKGKNFGSASRKAGKGEERWGEYPKISYNDSGKILGRGRRAEMGRMSKNKNTRRSRKTKKNFGGKTNKGLSRATL